MKLHKWKDEGLCVDYDTNLFFDKYEDGTVDFRKNMDQFCQNCPVLKTCFAVGVSGKEYGLWGGVYLEQGEPSREFNVHKTKEDWAIAWQSLMIEK